MAQLLKKVIKSGFILSYYFIRYCREGAYTCFNQKIGAEEYNYGSRIDHILISGACLHHCDSAEDHSIFCCHVEECGKGEDVVS